MFGEYDSKVQKDPKVLSKTADMTTDFFKNKAKKKAGEAGMFEKIGNHKGKIQEEK